MVRKTVKEKFSDHVLGPRFISMQDFGKTKYNFLYIMPHFLSTREITFFSPKVLSFRENHFRNTEDVLFLSLSFLLFFFFWFLYGGTDTSTIPTTAGEEGLPNICIIDYKHGNFRGFGKRSSAPLRLHGALGSEADRAALQRRLILSIRFS